MDIACRAVCSASTAQTASSCGAVGQPGQRIFYLQAAKGEQVVSVALEKTQVAVLAERLATLLLALRQGGVAIGEERPEGAADV